MATTKESAVDVRHRPLLDILIHQRSTLVASATGITGCQSTAEEVVQEAYFRLVNVTDPTIPIKARVSYVFQVVRNLSIDYYRRHTIEKKRFCHEDDGLNVESHWGNPDETHQSIDTLKVIDKALSELPARTRYVFEMYRIHGKEQKEIAKELGVSPTLINFMVKDALLHLKKTLSDEREAV